MRAASNDSFAVPPSAPATASAYIDSNAAADARAPPRMPNWPMFVIATAPAPPERMRGMAGDSATARSGDASLSFFAADRARQKSILGRLHAGRARLHEVLRVEMRARRVGRADRVNDGQRCDP